MGRPFKPNCAWCGAPREKGITCRCRKRASYDKHGENYRQRLRDEYAANPQLYKDRVAEYTVRNYDKVIAAHKRWRQENPDKAQKHSTDWRERNLAKSSAIKRAWKSKNPDAVRLYVQKRRFRMQHNGGHLSVAEWQGICDAQEQRCYDCHRVRPLTVGHIIPVVRGGSNHHTNVIAQCQSCNSKQGRQIHPLFRDAVNNG